MSKKQPAPAYNEPNNESAWETVHNRNLFYRDGYRRLVSISVFLALGLLLTIGIIFFLATRDPVIQNYAATESGRIIPIHPLSAPFLNSEIIKNFASDCAIKTNSVTFGDSENIKQQISGMQHFFTKHGYENFLKALRLSGNIEMVKKEKLIISAGSSGAPIITGEGIREGVYVWKVEVPLNLTVFSFKGKRSIQRTVNLLITRVPVVDNPRSIAVDQYIISNKSD